MLCGSVSDINIASITGNRHQHQNNGTGVPAYFNYPIARDPEAFAIQR
jgi:hypothetical protein